MGQKGGQGGVHQFLFILSKDLETVFFGKSIATDGLNFLTLCCDVFTLCDVF